MPKVVSKPEVVSRKIQRHYPPLTNRCIFKGERLLPRSSMTSQRIFPLSDETTAASRAPTLAKDLIPKPPGEAGRPGRNGYSLEETLCSDQVGWDKEFYTSVQVCRHSTYFRVKLIQYTSPEGNEISREGSSQYARTSLATGQGSTGNGV